MRSWTRPVVPQLPGHGAVPRIYDTATRQLVEAHPIAVTGLYVCGITPYDATHIGHAATYLAFDTLIRLWLDAGRNPLSSTKRMAGSRRRGRPMSATTCRYPICPCPMAFTG